MEENISREAGATAGQYTSPEDFQALILETGRIPAERNTAYTRIRIKQQPEPFIGGIAPSGVRLIMAGTIAVLGGTGPEGFGPRVTLGPGRRNSCMIAFT